MTVQEMYDYLGSIRKIDSKIVRLQLQHDELESCLLPKAITYDSDKVQTSPDDPMSRIASEVLDLEKEIQMLRIRKARRVKEISVAITKLDDDIDQIILTAFYIGRLPASKVAEITHYSIRGVYNAKHRAVIHLTKVCTKCM